MRCLHLRNRSDIKHQIIAVACSIDHARQVRAIYEERGLEAREIYSEMDDDSKSRVLEELRRGRIDCIVQVQMLGEAFDHPPLSVAAIFRPFRSLSAYVQFVGRSMRVNQEGDPAHHDNFGYIVSHIGLNNDAHWQDFREFDLEDQALLRLWLEGKTVGEDLSESAGEPRRFDVGMQVQNEIISHFIGSLFLDPDDDRVLDLIVEQKIPGTPFTVGDLKSREALREMLRTKRKEHEHRAEIIPVSPQRRRRAAKKRLAERTNSVVARVIRDLDLSLVRREVGNAIAQVRGSDNRIAVTRLLNLAINDSVGIPKKSRLKMTAVQAERALQSLDRLGDEVRERIRQAMEGSRGQDA